MDSITHTSTENNKTTCSNKFSSAFEKFSNAFDSIIVLGPTASGKTSLAVQLASLFNGEIISADSRQVYKGMDIGTGKDLDEYNLPEGSIKVHLVDILNPSEEFDLFKFASLANNAVKSIQKNNKIPIICGGTGLYLSALIQGYTMSKVPENKELRVFHQDSSLYEIVNRLIKIKPDLHNSTDVTDKKRALRALEIALHDKKNNNNSVDFCSSIKKPLILGTRWDRPILRKRIGKRLEQRVKLGLIEEVKSLIDSGLGMDKLEWFGLEYRYIGRMLFNQLSRQEALETLKIKIGQFAKKQETWFRRMERQGVIIKWVDNADLQRALEIIDLECAEN